MIKFIFCLAIYGLFLGSFASAQTIAVIVNKTSPAIDNEQTINLKDIKNIYLGKTTYWKGSLIKPINQKDKKVLENFLKKVCDISISNYLNHWLKLELESGQNAPKVIDNPHDIIDYVKREKHAIGYVLESQLEDAEEIKVILLLPDGIK